MSSVPSPRSSGQRAYCITQSGGSLAELGTTGLHLRKATTAAEGDAVFRSP